MRLAILAGGRSRRMGRDKAWLPVDGVPLLRVLVDRLAVCGLPMVVLGRVAADSPVAELPHLPDERPGQGPLGGLATVLARWPEPVLLLACDLPRLSPAAVDWLAGAAGGGDGLVPICEGRLQPCAARYETRVAALVQERLAAERRSMTGLIAAGDFASPAVPEELVDAFINVNSPEDWEHLQL